METPIHGILFKGYTLIRLIARGGMGEVYEAKENKLQRRVALKIIAPPNPLEHDQDELVRRFLSEARTLAQINHPNVVTIFSIDSIGGVPFLAMEYIDGVSFRELLEEFTFAADGAIPLFIQMLEGLKCLHDARILHRDLKPHNILLRPDGQVKILDFGIAKTQGGTTDLTKAGIVVGTLPYMSPELKVGVPASVRSDLWSLGAIFFECLTGQRLVVALKDNGGHLDVPFTLEQQRRIPKDVRAFIGRMCASRPQDRFESTDQALLELQRLQATRPAASSRILANLSRKIDELARARQTEPSSTVASKRLLELVEMSRERELPALPPSMPAPVRESSVRESNVRELSTKEREAITAKPNLSASVPRPQPKTALPPTPPSKLPRRLGLVGGLCAVALAVVFIKRAPRPAAVPASNEVNLPNTPAANPAAASAQPAATVPAAPLASPLPIVTEVALALREPNEGQLLWLEPTSIATFTWTRFLQAGQYQIQIARDRDFRKVVVSENVDGTSFRPAQILAEGTYFWRLSPHGASDASTNTVRFSVGQLAPVELNEPDAEHVFPAGKGEVTFSWSAKPGVKRYRLQIGPDPGFSSTTSNEVVGQTQATLSVSPGEHYWRVRAEDVANLQKYWTPGRQFLVKAATPQKPTLTELREPRLKVSEQTVTLEFRHAPRDLASVSSALKHAPELKWEPVRGAKGYLVEISASKDFTHPLVAQKVSAPRLAWSSPVPGRAYWRVAALGNKGEKSAFSARGALDIRVPAPVLNKSYAIKSPSGAAIEWPAAPLAQNYVVQLGRDRGPAGAEERLVSSPRLDLDNPSGIYYARVASADAAGTPISQFSTPSLISVASLSPGPKLLQPSDGAHASSVSGRISIVFSWSKVDDAQNYALEVASDPEFHRLLQSRSTTERGSLFRQADFKGRVYWRVRAKTAHGYSEWSSPFHFDLR